MRNKINILSDETIIKIAAGEIIENPASIIKELVENSIDAGSTKISIEIKNNGSSLIKVTDNGEGFSKEDLKIAFKRHTTSKIKNIEELNNALTLGFRGEALSSIANVSEVTVVTKTDEDLVGQIGKVDFNGNIKELNEIVTNKGTTIICENLFENIPVRKKYLEGKNFEINKTNEIINKLMLSHTDVTIEYIRDDKLIGKTDKNTSLLNNIYSVLGKNIVGNLTYIEENCNNFRIYGYISNNNLYRANKSQEYFFVNNRSISDSNLSKIIEKQYTSIIPLNRYPVFIIYIDIDSNLLDVNIHPKKDIVKFLNIDELELSLSRLVSETLNNNLNIFEVERRKTESTKDIFSIYKQESVQNSNLSNNINQEKENSQLLSFKDYTNLEVTEDVEDVYIPLKKEVEIVEENFASNKNNFLILPNGYRFIGNLFKQYLLLEDNVEKSLYILDQHAAHERINYERLVKDYNSKSIPLQHLISGYIMELSNNEYEEIIGLQDLLFSIGFEIEEFGDNSIIIRTIPSYLVDVDPEKLIRDILDNKDEINTSIYDVNPYLLMKKACVASIKSGDYVSNMDVNRLIDQLRECDMPLTCPHGRPTLVKISKNQLDKEFFRIQYEG